MPLRKLIEQSLAQRRLSSVLTITTVALGVMLVALILVVRQEMANTYDRQVNGYGFVVGRGSPFDLVMTAVFHVREGTGLISHEIYDDFRDERHRPYLRLAVPYALGDSYRGHRIVATTDGIFDRWFPHPVGTGQEKLLVGRPFRFSHAALDEALHAVEGGGHDHGTDAAEHDHEHHEEGAFEAVVGWQAARDLGLRVGSRIEPSHGVDGEHEHVHEWSVVGILKRSGTALDRVIFINLDSFFRIDEHASGRLADGHAGISALLLFPRAGQPGLRLLAELRGREDLDFAFVAQEKQRIRDLLGNIDQVLLVVALVVVIIGIKSILVALLNTMNERRRELAILRAIGARRRTLLLAIVLESGFLALVGGILGVLLAHVALVFLRGAIESGTRLVIDPWRMLPEEAALVVGVALVGGIAGLVPAMKAYRTDVARNLAPLS